MGRESGATIRLAIKLDMFCFPPPPSPPAPPALLLARDPPFVLPLPPPPPPPLAFLPFSLLGVPLALLAEEDCAEDRRPDLEEESSRPLPPVPRLLVADAAEDEPRRWCPPPSATGVLLSLLLLPDGAVAEDRDPLDVLSPLRLECLSLAGVACLSLAVPRGSGGAALPAVPPLPPPLRTDRGLAGVTPAVLRAERRDRAGVTPS